MSNVFENRVLKAVAPVLNSGERAEFFSGTLFFTVANIERARAVEQTLKSNNFGDMIFNRVGDEYAVDFV